MEVYDTVILVELDTIREELEANEDSLVAFFEYFDRTWVGRRLGVTMKKALFPVPSWNHHQTLLTGRC